MIHKKNGESWTNAHENNLAGQFPLHHACRDGNNAELKRLLAELQNNVSNTEILIAEDPYYNWTAGHFAAYFGNLECLRLLMQAGAVYNSSRSSSGLTPLPCPLSMLSSRCRQSLLQVAAFASHPQCLQWLLQADATALDSQDVNGETALHKACRSGSWECAQLLVACRANTSIQNDNGLTPAGLALSCGHDRLVKQLGGGDAKPLNGLPNGINGHPNGVHTNDTSRNGHLLSGTPAACTPSVNHLVSSNGYYGFHQSHPQTPSASTISTGSSPSSASAHTSTDMAMDMDVPAVSSSNALSCGNLLTDAGVSQDLVPVAGKKRVREDDHLQQSKRGRFQVEGESLEPKDSPEGTIDCASREPFQNITNHSNFPSRLPGTRPHPYSSHPVSAAFPSSSVSHNPFTLCSLQQASLNRTVGRSSFSYTTATLVNNQSYLVGDCGGLATDGRTSRIRFSGSDTNRTAGITRLPAASDPQQPSTYTCSLSSMQSSSSNFSYGGPILSLVSPDQTSSDRGHGSSDRSTPSPNYMKLLPFQKSTLLDNEEVSGTKLRVGSERLFNYEKPFCHLQSRRPLSVDARKMFTFPTPMGSVSPLGCLSAVASIDEGFEGTGARQREDISAMFRSIHGCEMYIEEQDLDLR